LRRDFLVARTGARGRGAGATQRADERQQRDRAGETAPAACILMPFDDETLLGQGNARLREWS
jgi:hypothetical protein